MLGAFGHLDIMPFVYMLVLSIGIYSLSWKWKNGHKLGALAELAVFAILFRFHGGTIPGSLACAGTAIVVGNTILRRI